MDCRSTQEPSRCLCANPLALTPKASFSTLNNIELSRIQSIVKYYNHETYLSRILSLLMYYILKYRYQKREIRRPRDAVTYNTGSQQKRFIKV